MAAEGSEESDGGETSSVSTDQLLISISATSCTTSVASFHFNLSARPVAFQHPTSAVKHLSTTMKCSTAADLYKETRGYSLLSL